MKESKLYTKRKIAKKTGLSLNRVKYLIFRDRIRSIDKLVTPNRIYHLFDNNSVKEIMIAHKK